MFVLGSLLVEAVTSEIVRLIDTATVPILAVDVDGLVNGWNIKIAELTGLPIGEATGKHLLTLVEDSSTDRVKKMLNLALLGMSFFLSLSYPSILFSFLLFFQALSFISKSLKNELVCACVYLAVSN